MPTVKIPILDRTKVSRLGWICAGMRDQDFRQFFPIRLKFGVCSEIVLVHQVSLASGLALRFCLMGFRETCE